MDLPLASGAKADGRFGARLARRPSLDRRSASSATSTADSVESCASDDADSPRRSLWGSLKFAGVALLLCSAPLRAAAQPLLRDAPRRLPEPSSLPPGCARVDRAPGIASFGGLTVHGDDAARTFERACAAATPRTERLIEKTCASEDFPRVLATNGTSRYEGDTRTIRFNPAETCVRGLDGRSAPPETRLLRLLEQRDYHAESPAAHAFLSAIGSRDFGDRARERAARRIGVRADGAVPPCPGPLRPEDVGPEAPDFPAPTCRRPEIRDAMRDVALSATAPLPRDLEREIAAARPGGVYPSRSAEPGGPQTRR